MKKIIPNAESVLAFLRMKGWELEEKTSGFYIVKPPKEIKPQSFRLKIPHLSKELAYPVMIIELVNEIADFYDWNKKILRFLLAKSMVEIEQMLLASASRELQPVNA